MNAIGSRAGGELALGAASSREGGTTSGMLSTVTNISRRSSSKARWLSTAAGAGEVDDALDAFVRFCRPFPAEDIPESIDTVRTPATSVPTGLAFFATVA